MSEVHTGQTAVVILATYLVGTILIGYCAMRRNRSGSARDYFLGGKLTGAVVLFLTMQATQYSGNTFFGFTGMAYRSGLMWILVVPLICLVVTTQISFAPRLYVLSKHYDYLTPADYYADRYDSNLLRLLIALISIASMFPYLMIQAEATGHAFVGLTSGQFPFWSGVVFISSVMLVYVLIGGWRGVVWTDALQGVVLTVSIIAAAGVFMSEAGGLNEVLDYARTNAPEKISVPGSFQTLTASWLSLLIASGLGFAMYPQAIQKIYAARSEQALKTGLTLMMGVPFIIGTCTLLIGMAAWKSYPGLIGPESDRIFALMLNSAIQDHYWLVVITSCGILAAIMSTSSSVLLSLASIFTKDIYQTFFAGEADERTLTLVGRAFTIFILVLVVAASLTPTTTLWRLTEIKLEFLMQLFPPLILGLYWPRFSKCPAIAGLLAGTGIVAAMMLMGIPRWWNFQAGVYGFVVNITIGTVLAWLMKPTAEEDKRVSHKFFAMFRAEAKGATC